VIAITLPPDGSEIGGLGQEARSRRSTYLMDTIA
jgi:hypothetical protein